MDPLDTLLMSIGLIIEYGRIPIGDKIKITKTIENAREALEQEAKAKAEAKESLGLKGYSDMQARMVIALGGGDTEDHIDWGLEQYENGLNELAQTSNVQMLMNPTTSKWYRLGVSMAIEMNNPAFQLLQAFGYESLSAGKICSTRRKQLF